MILCSEIKHTHTHCKISDLHGGEVSGQNLLSFDDVLCYDRIPRFRRNFLPPSSLHFTLRRQMFLRRVPC